MTTTSTVSPLPVPPVLLPTDKSLSATTVTIPTGRSGKSCLRFEISQKENFLGIRNKNIV